MEVPRRGSESGGTDTTTRGCKIEKWFAVTLWFPPHKRASECKRLLSKWVHELGKAEGLGVGYVGGIFGCLSPLPPYHMQYHSHLILTGLNKRTGKTIADIDVENWKTEWRNNIAHISSMKATDIKQGDDLTGWLNYIFTSNPKKADDWSMAYHNTRLLCRLENLKHFLKGVKK